MSTSEIQFFIFFFYYYYYYCFGFNILVSIHEPRIAIWEAIYLFFSLIFIQNLFWYK